MAVILNSMVLPKKYLESNPMLSDFIFNYPEKGFEEGMVFRCPTSKCRLRIPGCCISNVWRVPSGTVDEIILELDHESAIHTASWLIFMILARKQGGVLCVNDGAERKMIMFRLFGAGRANAISRKIEKIRNWHFNSAIQPYRPIRKDRLRFEVLKDDFKDQRNWFLATGDWQGIMRFALTLLRHAQAREVSGLVFGQARHQVLCDIDSCWLTVNISEKAE